MGQSFEDIADLAEGIGNCFLYEDKVNLEMIANSENISFIEGNYGNHFLGQLIHYSNKFYIILNLDQLANCECGRIRFTIAHELGHYFIDEHRNALMLGLSPSHPSFTNFSSDNEVELEADFFASSLLIPTSRLLKDVYRRKFSFNIIEEIAAKYQTSITATLIKFASIGNHPIMIVCSVDKKIKWFKYSEDFPFKYIDTLSDFKVPQNTSAGRFFYENGTKCEGEADLVYAEDWFKLYNDKDYGRHFNEYCIYSDKNRFVLSVIWEK